MLQNPIHLRLERLESGSMSLSWLAYANACTPITPCSASKPVLPMQIYRRILHFIWETLTVKDAKVNFDSQLEKLKKRFLQPTISICTAFIRKFDACVALSELVHSRLSGETLEHAVEVSKTSITTVAMLEMILGWSRNER